MLNGPVLRVTPSPNSLRGGNVWRVTSLSGHAGAHAVAVAQRYGVTTMFTLSGGHVFPLYDGAVKADPPMRLVDVRHEQTAVFAAEEFFFGRIRNEHTRAAYMCVRYSGMAHFDTLIWPTLIL